MNYEGVIIEESLDDTSVLGLVKILGTEVEAVTPEHQTPWVLQWTIHTVDVPDDQADSVAEKIAGTLDPHHGWYTDFKNDLFHYIIFRGRFFKVDRAAPAGYDAAVAYGLSLGIPDYQLDFSPTIQDWARQQAP